MIQNITCRRRCTNPKFYTLNESIFPKTKIWQNNAEEENSTISTLTDLSSKLISKQIIKNIEI